MTALRRRMIEAMQLRGLAPGTQKAYLRAVRPACLAPWQDGKAAAPVGGVLIVAVHGPVRSGT